VQWHPELGWEKDALSRTLFEAFVEAAHSFASDNISG
jgi:gamma-glutamyl-gamma-aminobutyrate hydrolase PuuD